MGGGGAVTQNKRLKRGAIPKKTEGRGGHAKYFSSCRVDIVQLLSTKIVHFYDKSMKLCQIITNPKTNIFGYGAKPNSTLDTSTAQALKWPT